MRLFARTSSASMILIFALVLVVVFALKAVSRIFVQMTAILKVAGAAVTSFLLVVAFVAALLVAAVQSVR